MRRLSQQATFSLCLPEFLCELGYDCYCANHSKEDYNITQPKRLWDDSSQPRLLPSNPSQTG